MGFDGPHITTGNVGVSLGVIHIRDFMPALYIKGPAGWYVVKYDAESRIDIHWFNEHQVHELSREFGIPLWVPGCSRHESEAAFYHGAAWEALKKWVIAHPRIAKQTIQHDQPYLPGWYERALGLRPIPTKKL
ncbi:hypothetical protein D3C81_1888430 [compost metagenome]